MQCRGLPVPCKTIGIEGISADRRAGGHDPGAVSADRMNSACSAQRIEWRPSRQRMRTMTAIATPGKPAPKSAGQDAGAPPPARPLIAALLRCAWIGRNLWHRIARPLTMGVRALIIDGSDPGSRRVLLIRHSYVGGWHMPGGGVAKGETLVEAMRREVREEVGLRVESGVQPLGIYARFRHGASDHVAVFEVQDWSGVPTADGVEIVEARFFALDRLPADLSPATGRRLAEFLGHTPRGERW